MKKISFLLIAIITFISCSKTNNMEEKIALDQNIEVKKVVLNNQNDSINYAFGVTNGIQLKMYKLHNDSSLEAITEFIHALQRGYNGNIEQLSEVARIGKNLGKTIKHKELVGLADNPAWVINQQIFFQGLVNALHHDITVMTTSTARDYIQEQHQLNFVVDKQPTKINTGQCVNQTKTIVLKNQNDSINYAFGYLEGDEIAHYVLLSDDTDQTIEEFIFYVNQGITYNIKNPQLVEIGEQLGKSIKEEQNLFGEPSLLTDFALIKQGFINGLLGDTVMSGEYATRYIQTTLNNIKTSISASETTSNDIS